MALALGNRVLPTYAHRFAPKTFTQPQLLACLVLMRFHKTDYRGISAFDLPPKKRTVGFVG